MIGGSDRPASVFATAMRELVGDVLEGNASMLQLTPLRGFANAPAGNSEVVRLPLRGQSAAESVLRAIAMKQEVQAAHFWRYTLLGALTLAPLWVTWLVFEFIFGLLYRLGSPWVAGLARAARPWSDALADGLLQPWFRFLLAVLITIALLYAVGWVASRVVGERLLALFERLLQRIPLASTIYNATKKLIAAMREPPTGVQRVVLINFPSREMKTIGFVTRVIKDSGSGRELAAVYVPTAPNPTSGYIEIVPIEDLTPTEWTVDEAMRFIMTAGTSAPADLPFTANDAGAPPARGD